jgi:hypothetical protein
MRSVVSLTVLSMAAGVVPAADFPTAEITNGEIRAKLYLPDVKNGFYRSTRFDWSGLIASLEYKGHNYYGPWFEKIDPKIRDFGYVGPDVVVSPISASMGPAEEFMTDGKPLGWDEAKPGGTFIKIGIGVLRRPDAADYDRLREYEIVDNGKWTVRKTADSVEFTHEVADNSTGYGYTYRKVVRLTQGKPQMVIAHSLKNTGKRQIQTSFYNHNFLVLDQQPPGPDFSITFPFQIQARRMPAKALGEIRGNRIVYLKALAGEERFSTSFQGFSQSPSDYDTRIENAKVGAGMRIRGDRPLSNVVLWSIRTNVSVEPYHTMTIDTGKEFTWNLTYDYYTLPAK